MHPMELDQFLKVGGRAKYLIRFLDRPREERLQAEPVGKRKRA